MANGTSEVTPRVTIEQLEKALVNAARKADEGDTGAASAARVLAAQIQDMRSPELEETAVLPEEGRYKFGMLPFSSDEYGEASFETRGINYWRCYVRKVGPNESRGAETADGNSRHV